MPTTFPTVWSRWYQALMIGYNEPRCYQGMATSLWWLRRVPCQQPIGQPEGVGIYFSWVGIDTPGIYILSMVVNKDEMKKRKIG
jgi:hypothetical protein